MPKDQHPLENMTDPSEIVGEIIAHSGFMILIGTKVRYAGRDKVSLEIERDPTLLQYDRLFHGGVIASLADYAGASAAAVSTERGVPVLTSTLHVTFLSAAKGSFLSADATCIKAGSRLRPSRVEVFSDKNGKPEMVAVANMGVSVNTR